MNVGFLNRDWRNWSSDSLWLLVILFVATAMRFNDLGAISLSNDELSAITRVRYDSFTEMLEKGVMIDYHPAGVESFLFYWIRLFGDDVWWVRLPFVLFSLGSVYLVYRVGKQWFNSLTGLLGAAFFAVLEYPLLYSQLARMYSPGLFFSLLMVFYWTVIVNRSASGNPVRKKDWWLLMLAMTIGAHTHYFVVVFIFSVGVLGFFMINPKDRWRFLGCCLIAALSFSLELKVFFTQMETGDLGGWLAAPQPNFLLDYFFNCLNESPLLCLLLLQLLMFSFFFRQGKVSLNKFHVAGLVWFLFSFGLGYAYSVLRAPALQFSTLLFAFPFFFLSVLSIVPENYFSGRKRAGLLLAVLSFGFVSTVYGREYYRKPPFGVFKEVAADLSRWNNEYGGHPSVVNVINPAYMDYYFSRMDNPPRQLVYKVESVADLVRLREIVDTCTAAFYSYGWTNNHHPYEIHAILRERYPVVSGRKVYFNAETWLYSKSGVDTITKSIQTWSMGFDDPSSTFGVVLVPSAKTGAGVLQLTPEMEYGSGVQEKIKCTSTSFAVMYCSVWFQSADTSGSQSLVLSFEKNGTAVQWDNISLNDFNLHPGQWQQAFLARPVPSLDDSLEIKVYVWNADKRSFIVDNLVAKLEEGVDPYLRK